MARLAEAALELQFNLDFDAPPQVTPADPESPRRNSIEKRDAIFMAHRGFAIYMARRFYPTDGLTLEDLISWAELGMLKAAETFDEERGVKFVSYAKYSAKEWIEYGIALSKNPVACLPDSALGVDRTVDRATKFLKEQLDREPTLEEVARSTGESLEVLRGLAAVKGGVVPLFVAGEDSREFDVADPSPVDTLDRLDQEKRNQLVQAAISELLDERRAEITLCYYGISRPRASAEALSHRYGVTKGRIQQLIKSARKELASDPRLSSLLTPDQEAPVPCQVSQEEEAREIYRRERDAHRERRGDVFIPFYIQQGSVCLVCAHCEREFVRSKSRAKQTKKREQRVFCSRICYWTSLQAVAAVQTEVA